MKQESPLDWMIWLRMQRRRAMRIQLGLILVVGLIGMIASIIFLLVGNGRNLVPYSLTYLLIAFLFLVPNIPDFWRASGFLLILFSFAVFSFYSGWLVSGGRVFLITLIVVSALFISPRVSFWAAMLGLLTYIGFAFAYDLRWLRLGSLPDPTTPLPIAIEGVGFAMSVGLVTVSLWFYGQALKAATQANQDAQKSRASFYNIVERSTDGIIVVDQQGKVCFSNLATEAFRDHKGEGLIRESFVPMIPGDIFEMEIQKNGHKGKAEIRRMDTEWEGHPASLLFVRDITERKRAEEERQVLQELTSQFTASLTLKEMAKILAVQCQRLFEHDSFRFDLYDELPQTRMPIYAEDTPVAGAKPIDLEDVGGTVTMPEIIRSVFSGQKTLVNRKDGFVADGLQPWGFVGRRSMSMMFVPVRWQGQCIGVVSIQSYTPNQYNERDLELAQLVVEQCSATLVRIQAEAERERFILELEAKNAELERFVYTVSHDLKSPLVTINGFLGYLQKDAMSGNMERMQTDLERITDATDKMQRLLSELLELSRIGRMMNPPEEVLFGEIVNEAVALVHGQIETRRVEVRIAPDLPPVWGDRARLVEVVQNLLDNAVKFMGEQMQPVIEIGRRGADEKGNPIFYVRDNGVGIEPQYHEKVFGLFNKLDPHTEGTGVGLALVKRIVEVHGGRIWIESDGGGQGATFCFIIAPKP